MQWLEFRLYVTGLRGKNIGYSGAFGLLPHQNEYFDFFSTI